MTMGKISNNVALSKQKLVSPNLELASPTRKFKTNKATKKTINNSVSGKYLRVFKYLILSTVIIFTFGGLGFGFALRYGDNLQISQSQNVVDK